jgi:hypothetical protein
VQTLTPNIEPFINRKPMRQTMIEMASYLKNELGKKTGVSLKTKFNPISKWQRMNGAQTELVLYENKADSKGNLIQSNKSNNSDHLVLK